MPDTRSRKTSGRIFAATGVTHMHFHRDPLWAIVVVLVLAVGWHFVLRSFLRQNNIGFTGHIAAWVAFWLVAVVFMHVVRVF
jgi:uncharacterized membrane protein YhdT